MSTIGYGIYAHIHKLSRSQVNSKIFTACIRRMGEGNSFSLLDCPHPGGYLPLPGGYIPWPGHDRGTYPGGEVPTLTRSRWGCTYPGLGGVPQHKYCPGQVQMGVYLPWLGVPQGRYPSVMVGTPGKGRYPPPAKDLLHGGWYASCIHVGGLSVKVLWSVSYLKLEDGREQRHIWRDNSLYIRRID